MKPWTNSLSTATRRRSSVVARTRSSCFLSCFFHHSTSTDLVPSKAPGVFVAIGVALTRPGAMPMVTKAEGASPGIFRAGRRAPAHLFWSPVEVKPRAGLRLCLPTTHTKPRRAVLLGRIVPAGRRRYTCSLDLRLISFGSQPRIGERTRSRVDVDREPGAAFHNTYPSGPAGRTDSPARPPGACMLA